MDMKEERTRADWNPCLALNDSNRDEVCDPQKLAPSALGLNSHLARRVEEEVCWEEGVAGLGAAQQISTKVHGLSCPAATCRARKRLLLKFTS